MPVVFDVQDKILHAGAYFVMAIFSWRALRHANLSGRSLAIVSFLFCSAYGISDEWHQAFVPGRTPSALDWLADSLGATIAVFLLLKFNLMQRRRTASDYI